MKMTSSKHQKDASSVILLHIFKVAVQFVAFIVISRFTEITEVGYFAISIMIIGLLELIRDFGLRVTSTQSTNIDKVMASNLFWISSIIGFAIFTFTLVISSILIDLQIATESMTFLRLLSVSLFLSGISSQLHTNIVRQQKFFTFGLIDFVSQTFGAALGIWMATNGYGAMSFVFQYLASSSINLALRGYFADLKILKPNRLKPTLQEFKSTTDLGLVQLLNWLGNNFDTLVITLRFEAFVVGIYSRAFGLVITTQQSLVDTIGNWALPMLKHSSTATAELSERVFKLFYLLSMVFIPLNIFFIGTHSHLIEFLLGEKWSHMGLFCVAFSFSMIFGQATAFNRWILILGEQTSLLLRQTYASKVVLVVSVIIASNFSALLVAYVFALNSFVLLVISYRQSKNHGNSWSFTLSKFIFLVFMITCTIGVSVVYLNVVSGVDSIFFMGLVPSLLLVAMFSLIYRRLLKQLRTEHSKTPKSDHEVRG